MEHYGQILDYQMQNNQHLFKSCMLAIGDILVISDLLLFPLFLEDADILDIVLALLSLCLYSFLRK